MGEGRDPGDVHAEAASPMPRDAPFWGVLLLAGAAVAIIDALTVAHDRAEAGQPIALWQPLVWDVTSVAVIIALAPAVMSIVRRAPIETTPWPRLIALHVVAAIVFSAVHVAAMGVLRWGVYAALGARYAPLGPLADFPYELRKDLVTYGALVVLYAGWRRLAPPGETPDAAEGDILEVRDGRRRHFVAWDQIDWIEAAGNYVELHWDGPPLLHRAALAEMERRAGTQGFVRIHRSRLVRRAAIAGVDSKPSGDFVVRLGGGAELAGSRRYRRPLLDA